MLISIIASVSKNRVIGKNGSLPWYIPEDLEWFKEKTMGHHVLMGRKTYESINKSLKGRKIIVVTKNQGYQNPDVYIFHSIKEAIDFAGRNNETELFIAGGEDIYKQTINLADRIYITRVNKHYSGDRFFPEFNIRNYKLIYRKNVNTDPLLEFLIYEKNHNLN